MSNVIMKKLDSLTWGLFKFSNVYCDDDKNCNGFTMVHRINLSLGVFHLILLGLTLGVNSTSNPRAVIQNGFWRTKLLAWGLLLLLSFMIPDKFFVVWGMYFSIVFSTMFIGIGLILLVDFAHEWAETCIEKIEEGEIYIGDETDTNTSFWKTLLVGGTISMYLGSVIMTILMYIFFSRSGCGLNTTLITLNSIFVLVITLLSVTPVVQDYNPNAGLAQLSMCCIYCTYLIFSACLSEPDDKLCNPLIRSRSTRISSIVIGAIFTFIAVAYTTTRAAGNSAFQHNNDSTNYGNSLYDSVVDVITHHPPSNEMRLEAIRQAVDEGTLPESALTDPEYLYDDDQSTGEERISTKYNYVLFHIIFFLATQYIAALLTINVGVEGNSDGFVPVGRTYFNTWVKIISSWCCFTLYAWSLLAPVVFPDRF